MFPRKLYSRWHLMDKPMLRCCPEYLLTYMLFECLSMQALLALKKVLRLGTREAL